VLPEAKSLSDVLREGLMGGETSLPLGIKFDGLDSMIQTMPKEVQGQMRSAVRMVNMLHQEGMLMGLPGGITEVSK
jgi:hypothetical protein